MHNIYIALENIRSIHNVGAIFRTASFFGIKNIILVGYSGVYKYPGGKKILHPNITKSSLGSEKSLSVTFMEEPKNLINFASENNLKIFSLEQENGSIPLEQFTVKNDFILVLGNEVTGVSDEILKNSNGVLEITKKGAHNSLNVTTSSGIALFHITQER